MDPNLQHKSQTSATNATLPSLKQGIWGHIWKGTVEKNQTNATNVTLPLLSHLIWGGISKRTVEKNLTNVISVTLHHLMQTLWRSIWEWMHSGEKSNKCNQCDFSCSYASAFENTQWRKTKQMQPMWLRIHLRTHLKTHSEEKSNKCNQCDYAPSRTGDLRKHLKMHSGVKSNKCNQCEFASSQLRLVYLDIMQYF